MSVLVQAWRHNQALQQLRRQAAVGAARQVMLGRARRCLHAWRQQSGRLEERLLPRARALLRRSLLARCWREWRRVCGLRWWKLQLELRDAHLQQLGAQASRAAGQGWGQEVVKGLSWQGIAMLRLLQCSTVVGVKRPRSLSCCPCLQLRRAESRPVRLMLRYRLRAILSGWQREARYQSAKQAARLAAEQQARRAALCAALGGWLTVASEKAAARRAVQRAQQRLSRLRMRYALLAWRDELGAAAGRHAAKQGACQLWRCKAQWRVLRGWRFVTWFRRTSRFAAAQQQLRLAAAAFNGWRQQADLLAVRQRLLQDLSAARVARLLSRAFGAWLAAVEGLRSRRQADALERSAQGGRGVSPMLLLLRGNSGCTDTLNRHAQALASPVSCQFPAPRTPKLLQVLPPPSQCRLGSQAEQLAGENAWLRKECERLGRVIDSGEWGQQRVQELLQAGRVLREERDGLAALVGALQAQQAQQARHQAQIEPVQGQRGPATLSDSAQPCDINGGPPAATCAPSGPQEAASQQGEQLGAAYGPARRAGFGSGPLRPPSAEPGRAVAGRNRLLVQSGSSFNALVRAHYDCLAG